MKDKENMIITKIQGTDFTYNKETHYEKDGHIYGLMSRNSTR